MEIDALIKGEKEKQNREILIELPKLMSYSMHIRSSSFRWILWNSNTAGTC